jgi:hypothetical protein
MVRYFLYGLNPTFLYTLIADGLSLNVKMIAMEAFSKISFTKYDVMDVA